VLANEHDSDMGTASLHTTGIGAMSKYNLTCPHSALKRAQGPHPNRRPAFRRAIQASLRGPLTSCELDL
jgi:hypothetical protein